MKKKQYCGEVDCDGVPGCACMKPEYWERWKFERLHNKQELFNLASDLLQELQVCRKFVRTRERMHLDGLAMLDELIASSATVIERKWDA
jgi:hypothetical protein